MNTVYRNARDNADSDPEPISSILDRVLDELKTKMEKEGDDAE